MLVFRALVLHVGLGGEGSSYDQTVRDVMYLDIVDVLCIRHQIK